MNVGSIFELANRTGLWVFCGVRREDERPALDEMILQPLALRERDYRTIVRIFCKRGMTAEFDGGGKASGRSWEKL
jgi:hypothetical protein